MHKKLSGLFCFLFLVHCAQATEFYTEQLSISNKTPYLYIKIPQKNEEIMAAGPTDATVIDNTFVLLDSWGSRLVYFDKQGNFLNSLALPKHTYFERIVRDRDNSLFVLGAEEDINSKHMMVLHIQNGMIREKARLQITENFINEIIPDDDGLFMNRKEEYIDRQKLAEACDDCQEKVLEEMIVHIKDKINRNCLSCEPKPTNGIRVNGLLYRLEQKTNQPLIIGNKKMPLLFYPQAKDNYSKIIQVDEDGTVWVENIIRLDAYLGLTYVWKINQSGKIAALYRFAADTEERGTIWPMKNNIIVSNNGVVYGITANKEQLKFRRLKAFSLKEMRDLSKKLDPILLKKKLNQQTMEEKFTRSAHGELTTGICHRVTS
ncbi:hypothetical protein [Legionella sp. km772]|uniref:hypothetical protein n=1 Tax=Legionella sp. km772 TaxID=2498111 RepID=UPI000F8F31CA|nr:hypothetical protein [Legionella sp. km772]RUR06572.1 hypothetical protein ELY15_13070 [Legionella sp. km772]